jgi:hypothetical protein
MYLNKWTVALGLSFLTGLQATAQEKTTADSNKIAGVITQKIHGIVTDASSKQPLPGVVVLLQTNNNINAISDDKGFFEMSNVPVGRQTFIFKSVGFEDYVVPQAMVISGKQLDLNISMSESIKTMKEVTIRAAAKDRTKPMNEFATLSARAFSVEETRRYAAAFADPGRMVQNFPGVSNAGDMDNSIVVRGNSPKGVLWKMEGIEIPNPNHFASQGTSGGPISMLNANTLGSSDFYTGAFVPEIGNALSGAFDLTLRNGNTEKYEHSFQLGTLGIELATEGPLSKKNKSSYLVNYRYSTLTLLKSFIDVGAAIPNYQDGSFKLNLPTAKAGTFTVWGLGGYNRATATPENDSSKWDDKNPNIKYDSKGQMMVGGLSHQYFVSKDAYIKTIVSVSQDKATNAADTLNPTKDYITVPVQQSTNTNTAIRATVMYNQKLSAQHSFRVGVIGQNWTYDLSQQYFESSFVSTIHYYRWCAWLLPCIEQ